MKNMKKAVALVLCVVLTVSVLSISALATNANVTYSGNAGKFIFSPGSKYSLTDLFPNFKDVMPGDTLTQKITVNNDADNNVKVKIYIRSLGAADESYVDFLNQLHLTVQKAEDTPMFDAAADKTDGLTEWTYLGTLYATARQNGWMSANDIRELENMDRIPTEDGGDLYLINGNMLPLQNAGAFANIPNTDEKEEESNEEQEVLELAKTGTERKRTRIDRTGA